MIISTHLISDIEPFLNYVVFLQDGRLIRQGEADKIRTETGMSIDALFREDFKLRLS